jgi:DNA ligase-4
MPFRFSYVGDLLQQLDDNQQSRTGQTINSNIVEKWFSEHRACFAREDFNAAPLLSTLLPEKRTDRVYFLQSRALARLICRGLCLGISRVKDLERWEQPGAGVDLGDCVQRVLTDTVSTTGRDEVMIEH